MSMLRNMLIALLVGSVVFAAPGQQDRLPRSPKDFHEQEFARIKSGLERMSLNALDETQEDFDVVYYDLKLDIRDFYGETISGEVTTYGKALVEGFNEVALDLCTSFTIDSIKSEGVLLAYSHSNNVVTITLNRSYTINEVFSVTVCYHGTPCQTNLFETFDYWNRYVSGTYVPSIATLSEPYGARDWWPSKNTPADKADSARIAITVADTLTATSNGVLESVTPVPPSSQTFTWFESHPIASYLICMSATNYVEWEDWYVYGPTDSMPIVNYVYPERLSQSLISWDGIPEILGVLEELFGEYAFRDEKYGQTMFGWGGAMEHQCNTTYGYGLTNGNHSYDYIIAHEAAHQWWGDDVTLHTWPDIWLNEGFASYSEALWTEHEQGFTAYKNYMASGLSVFDPSGPVYDPDALFNANTVYDKGAWLLHMLRGILRDDPLFFSAIAEYRARHHYGTATTDEFLGDISDVVGFDITPYLYTYLYRTNRPHFQTSWGNGVVDGEPKTAVHISQTQTNPDTTFRTRIELVFDGASDTTVIVENSEWETTYLFDFGFAPSSLTVDPDVWILRDLISTSLPPTILNSEVDAGELAVSYLDTLAAIGGATPYSWSLAGGALPDGVTLSPAGVLSGVPTESGEFLFTAQLLDDNSDTDIREFSLFIQGDPETPEGLTCYRTSDTEITLRWLPAMGADEYEVYRLESNDFSGLTPITSTADTFFIDTMPGGDAVRFYQVVSVRY